MIELNQGNILMADAEALVNTVNCIGFMGKGIALQFKKAYPQNFDAYHKACTAGEVQPGRMFIVNLHSMLNPKYVVNFPTKRHWRGNSRYEDIASGLEALVVEVRQRGIQSIAIPPLGCGLGGLDWNKVRPMIEEAFASLPGVRVVLFEPAGAPEAKAMPVRTERPKLTVARALFIRLMEQYVSQSYRLTLLEIQKLAYFLQEAGQPLKLQYQAGHYGPYAPNLNKVLEALERHYTSGYGDSQKPDVEIDLLEGAALEAEVFLASHTAEHDRLARVNRLIEGFETPYGLELLSSVHWLAVHGTPAAQDKEAAVTGIAGWSDRKRRMFRPEHIRVAWNRLASEGWIR
ncbi:MAG: type II toxin-antitoxin system antitoxin DNA ADP-ribosyl glycohydrolase DarG [Terrimicrobiaceae bacterium]